MTVRELIHELEQLPSDAEVTDVYNNPISEVCHEPDEIDRDKMLVWLDTDYIYDRH